MHRRDFLKHAAFIIVSAKAPLAAAATGSSFPDHGPSVDIHIKDRLIKQRHFDHSFNDDIFLPSHKLPLLNDCVTRLKQLQKIVGYGHFALLNFDDAIKIAKAYSAIGSFKKEELDFLEMIFYSQVQRYGFMGKKPIKQMTGKIIRKDVQKIPHTGNYLYRGKPEQLYEKIIKEIGSDAVLTSGVRSVIKQFYLFLKKTQSSNGNLSMASRSLAPPGYSYHGVGDFDVGQKGYGIHNFTERFTRTDVYHKLVQLGYTRFRYEKNNNLGVRFEPWHIEVI